MMTELSLNVLDVAENSIKAKASLVEISVTANTQSDLLTIVISDNGCGMSEETLNKVTDPFFTSRTTRKVGLGVSFFKLAAESSGGEFSIISAENVGTAVNASFRISNIDRMPLGDMPSTVHSLVTLNEDTDFIYTYTVDDRSFTLDTREFKEILGGVSFNIPEISAYIRDYLVENSIEVQKNVVL